MWITFDGKILRSNISCSNNLCTTSHVLLPYYVYSHLEACDPSLKLGQKTLVSLSRAQYGGSRSADSCALSYDNLPINGQQVCVGVRKLQKSISFKNICIDFEKFWAFSFSYNPQVLNTQLTAHLPKKKCVCFPCWLFGKMIVPWLSLGSSDCNILITGWEQECRSGIIKVEVRKVGQMNIF